MIRILGTLLAGLFGLAFGSFLNVCLSRWPEGESIVHPRSHCRNCGRTLAWWENIPVLSWLALRARCRTCKAKISWRYPLVEVAVGTLWAYFFWTLSPGFLDQALPTPLIFCAVVTLILQMFLVWLLIALAYLDVENLWLPDWLTYPGIAMGFAYTVVNGGLERVGRGPSQFSWQNALTAFLVALFSSAASAALVLVIRGAYWLIRRREGIGLGDAKLMAMLGAWLGLSGALLSFAIGVLLGAMFALVALAIPAARRESDTWLAAKLPLGTFLCIGGIITALWGRPIITAYLHYAGL